MELFARLGIRNLIVAGQVAGWTFQFARPGGHDVHQRRTQPGANAAGRFETVEGFLTLVGVGAGQFFHHRLKDGILRDLQFVVLQTLADPVDGGVGPVFDDFGAPGENQLDSLKTHLPDGLDRLFRSGIAGAEIVEIPADGADARPARRGRLAGGPSCRRGCGRRQDGSRSPLDEVPSRAIRVLFHGNAPWLIVFIGFPSFRIS